MAFRVYDEFDKIEALEDGAFLVRARLPRDEGLFQYVLSFGEHCQVQEPPEVREEIIGRLKKTLDRYQI
jgi:predicted DNA-binding transcriptional regulator YafY